MAPNGATGRKAPTPAVQKSGTTNVSLQTLFDDLDDAEAKFDVRDDVRKALPVVKKPGNWDSEINNGRDTRSRQPLPTPPASDDGGNPGTIKGRDGSQRSNMPSGLVNKIPSSVAKAFPTNRPMKDTPDVLKCTHCKRAVNRHVMPKHIEGCLNKKQEKQRKKKEAKDARDAAARKQNSGTVAGSDDEDGEDGDGKTTASKTGGLTGSKKRKAEEGEGDAGPTKKKKKKDSGDNKKAARPKAPVDVEKQCGVELPQGGQCARSLTCKSHSMGAKRAVPGRSKRYDQLLAEYQRKNAAKLQKAQFDANAPSVEDETLPTGPVDSEEEKDGVMAGIARSWGGAPIHQPTVVPLRKRYEYNRLRGMLQSAFSGRGVGGSNFSGGLFGSASGGGFFSTPSMSNAAPAVQPPPGGPVVDADGIVHARRGSVVPGARSMMAPGPTSGMGQGSRKASVASLGAA